MPKIFNSPPGERYQLQPELSELAETARVLPDRAYLDRLRPAILKGIYPWMTAFSMGEVSSEDDIHRLEVKEILVNGRVRHLDPRLAELFALEEAARALIIRDKIFGPEGILAKSDENAKRFVPHGWIDPHFTLRDARIAGLELGRKCAQDLADSALFEAFMSTNFQLIQHYLENENEQSVARLIGKGQWEDFMIVYKRHIAFD